MQSSRAYNNFFDSLRAEKTKQAYCSGLNSFRRFANVDDYDALLMSESRYIQDRIIDYVRFLRSRNLAYQTIRVMLAAVRHFYVMNDVVINMVSCLMSTV